MRETTHWVFERVAHLDIALVELNGLVSIENGVPIALRLDVGKSPVGVIGGLKGVEQD